MTIPTNAHTSHAHTEPAVDIVENYLIGKTEINQTISINLDHVIKIVYYPKRNTSFVTLTNGDTESIVGNIPDFMGR